MEALFKRWNVILKISANNVWYVLFMRNPETYLPYYSVIVYGRNTPLHAFKKKRKKGERLVWLHSYQNLPVCELMQSILAETRVNTDPICMNLLWAFFITFNLCSLCKKKKCKLDFSPQVDLRCVPWINVSSPYKGLSLTFWCGLCSGCAVFLWVSLSPSNWTALKEKGLESLTKLFQT